MLSSLKKQNLLVLVLLLLTFSLYWIKTNIYLDPDFGYRLRNGQILLEKGIDGIRTDPFSYTMSGYEFVEHSWLSAILIAVFYSNLGMVGTALLFTFFALLSLGISIHTVDNRKSLVEVSSKVFRKNLWHFGNPVFLLSIALIFGIVGVRVQVISWLLFSVLVYITTGNSRWERYKYLIPPLFLLWVNLHASFFEGVIVLSLIVFFKTFDFNNILKRETYKGVDTFIKTVGRNLRKGRFVPTNYFILVTSLVLTLINPYGVGAWNKVLLVASNTSLRWEINEWKPAVISFNPVLIVFATLSFIFVFRYLKRFPVERVFLYLFTFVQGVSSVRHIPLWIIIALPMTTEAIYDFYQETGKRKSSEILYKKFYKIFWIGCVGLLFFNIVLGLSEAIGTSEDLYYPKDALEKLRLNLPDGEVFSTYAWGGYLSWKFPERKVFVSGLMPIWNYEEVPKRELKNAYQTYNAIVRGEQDYQPVFEMFDINMVLWDPSLTKRGGGVDRLLGGVLMRFGLIPGLFDLGKALENDGWVKTYQDNVSIIYKRAQ